MFHHLLLASFEMVHVLVIVYLLLNNVAYHQILAKNYPIKKKQAAQVCVFLTLHANGVLVPLHHIDHLHDLQDLQDHQHLSIAGHQPLSVALEVPWLRFFIRNDDECWEFFDEKHLKMLRFFGVVICSGHIRCIQTRFCRFVKADQRVPGWWSKAEKIQGFHFYEEVEFVKWCLSHAMSWIQTHRDIRY